MARHARLGMVVALCLASFAGKLCGEPPRTISEYVSAADLELELTARLEELEPYLADADAFSENRKRIERSASMLVVAAQALVDHDDDSPRKPFAADLRDAARQIAGAEEFAAATASLAKARAALEGKTDKSAPAEFDWARLVGQRAIMEDTENRMQQLQRALRRPKDPVKESQLATAIVIASLPTLVDTHEVKDKTKLPEWEKLAGQLVDQMHAVSQAIKAKQPMEAGVQFKAARGTCVECHRQFKEEF